MLAAAPLYLPPTGRPFPLPTSSPALASCLSDRSHLVGVRWCLVGVLLCVCPNARGVDTGRLM